MPRFTRSPHKYLSRTGLTAALRRPLPVVSLRDLVGRTLPVAAVPDDTERYKDGRPPPDRGAVVRPV